MMNQLGLGPKSLAGMFASHLAGGAAAAIAGDVAYETVVQMGTGSIAAPMAFLAGFYSGVIETLIYAMNAGLW